jgi:hypothetical protein
MRDLVIAEIEQLLKLAPLDYTIPPLAQWSNQDLLAFYGDLRIEIETEEYDDFPNRLDN